MAEHITRHRVAARRSNSREEVLVLHQLVLQSRMDPGPDENLTDLSDLELIKLEQ